MKYRHSFHAGNFADVHKHVALLALLRSMCRKDKGFLYVDTHAGAGAYDLASAPTRQGAEARHGIVALLAAGEPHTEELRHYRQAVQAWRRLPSQEHTYPGSAAMAARSLRPQDRGLCCEALPSECRALERTLGGFRRMLIECGDGYRKLQACLPCVERRCLILIDPPYEDPAAECKRARGAICSILQRQANAVIALWYPIKDERSVAPWASLMQRELGVALLSLEFWLYPRDARVGLNGSGLLIVNPPYQFEPRADAWQRELSRLLDAAGLGGSAVRAWLAASASSCSHAEA